MSKKAQKQVKKMPDYIQEALLTWVEFIETYGINALRLMPGYRDEALKGIRKGQRSSRLNRAYRVIYKEGIARRALLIRVLEVNKHEY